MGREEQGREVLTVPSRLIIGRTADGKVAGILLGSVET